MTPLPSNPALPVSEIGGYRTVEGLSDQNWIAVAPGGRKVVLKALDEDCLWKSQLHPNVKDRLARVRELAHSAIANLYGVERDGGLVYLVWEFVEGITLEEFAASPRCSGRDLLLMAREIVLCVEMLHARGIVHGMIKASNVIVTPDGRAVLTHVSPLLYNDPAQDTAVLVGMIRDLLETRNESDSPLGRLLEQAADEQCSLRRLAARLAAAIDARDADVAGPAEREAANRIKRRAIMGAGATALVGIALFFGLKQYASARTPKPPVAPQAAPAALHSGSQGENPGASGGTRGTP